MYDDHKGLKFTIQSQEENTANENDETIVLSKETVDYLFSTGALKSDNLRSRSLDRITLNMAWEKLTNPEEIGSPNKPINSLKLEKSKSEIVPLPRVIASLQESVENCENKDIQKESNDNMGTKQFKSGYLPKEASSARIKSKKSNKKGSEMNTDSPITRNSSTNDVDIQEKAKGQKYTGKRKQSEPNPGVTSENKRDLRRRNAKKVTSESEIYEFSDVAISDSDDENWSPVRKKKARLGNSERSKISSLRRKTIALGEINSKGMSFNLKKKSLGKQSPPVKESSPKSKGQRTVSTERNSNSVKGESVNVSFGLEVPNVSTSPAVNNFPTPATSVNDPPVPDDLTAPDDLPVPDDLPAPSEDIEPADVFECHLCHKTFNHFDRMTIHYRYSSIIISHSYLRFSSDFLPKIDFLP